MSKTYVYVCMQNIYYTNTACYLLSRNVEKDKFKETKQGGIQTKWELSSE